MRLLFEIYLRVEKHIVKKNNRQIGYNRATGKPFPIKSADLKKYENHLKTEFLFAWRQRFMNAYGKDSINEPVNVKMLFYFNNYLTTKGSVNKNMPDLSNIYQVVEDALQEACVLEDDFLIYGHDGSRRLPSADDNHYLKVEVYKHEV